MARLASHLGPLAVCAAVDPNKLPAGAVSEGRDLLGENRVRLVIGFGKVRLMLLAAAEGKSTAKRVIAVVGFEHDDGFIAKAPAAWVSASNHSRVPKTRAVKCASWWHRSHLDLANASRQP